VKNFAAHLKNEQEELLLDVKERGLTLRDKKNEIRELLNELLYGFKAFDIIDEKVK
jgi:hypothetical protein